MLGNGGRNHTATVEAMVEAGADVTLPDRHGMTALQHARARGYSQIARILETPAHTDGMDCLRARAGR